MSKQTTSRKQAKLNVENKMRIKSNNDCKFKTKKKDIDDFEKRKVQYILLLNLQEICTFSILVTKLVEDGLNMSRKKSLSLTTVYAYLSILSRIKLPPLMLNS